MTQENIPLKGRVFFDLRGGATEEGTVTRTVVKARSTNVTIVTDEGKTYVRAIDRVRRSADTRGEPDYSVNHVS
jgi:hypothetical protein